jgi:phthalate 4,5-dioxygenase oxygenase subunit
MAQSHQKEVARRNNELLTRVGPTTSMGKALRRFWMPALLSSEITENDSVPVRLRILGEDLVAFRDTKGRVGIVDAYCPHKRAPLFFGRNEECGLRCVYHGWKFDVQGNCVDIPNIVPPDNYETIVTRMKIVGYETREAGGLVWVYMGPKGSAPELPHMEWLDLPPEYVHISRWLQKSNWVQGMEGEIDTSHISFLHKSGNMEDTLSKGASIAEDGAPVIFIKETSCGFYYGARRRYKDHFYWRVSHWLMPMWSVIPATPEEYFGHGRGWVPVDDYWTTTFAYRYRIDRPLNEADMAEIRDGVSFPPRMNRGSIELPHGYIIDTFLPTANKGNDYLIDRSIQRTQSFTGIFGINEQDRGLQESMPSAPGERPGIVDRSEEHLVASDAPTVKARWMLMRMAKDIEDGKETQAVRHADMYGVRSIAKLSSIGDWDEFIAENVQLMQATFRPEQQAAAISSQRPQA